MIVSVGEGVGYGVMGREKGGEWERMRKGWEIEEVEGDKKREEERIGECGCEVMGVMVRKGVGVEGEGEECESGGEWEELMGEL